jgi:hypothetical protein
LMNDAQLSQTAGRAKTRQPGHLVKPTEIVLNGSTGSYFYSAAKERERQMQEYLLHRKVMTV